MDRSTHRIMKPHFTLPLVTLCKCCVLCVVVCCVMCGCWCGLLAVTVTSVAPPPPPPHYSELHSALRDEQITTAPLMSHEITDFADTSRDRDRRYFISCIWTLNTNDFWFLTKSTQCNPRPSENWIQWTFQECHHSQQPEKRMGRPLLPCTLGEICLKKLVAK